MKQHERDEDYVGDIVSTFHNEFVTSVCDKELTGISPVEDADLVKYFVHVLLVLRLGRVPLGVGEEGDEEGHPLAAVGAVGRPQS